jgi:hypothetical protein
MQEVVAAVNIFGDEITCPQRHFDRVFYWGAASQSLRERVVQVLEMGKPANAPMTMHPIEDRLRIFLEILFCMRKPKGDNVTAQGQLGSVLSINRIEMPLRVPVDNPPRSGNGIITPRHERQISQRVLHLAIAHIRQQRNHCQILIRHCGVDIVYGVRGGTWPAISMHMHVARIPARGRHITSCGMCRD